MSTSKKKSKKDRFIVEVRYPFQIKDLIGLLPNKPPARRNLFGQIEDFLQSKFGESLEEDVTKDCPIYLVVSKEDVGPGTLLFVIIMDREIMYNNEGKESIPATIVHCISQVPEVDIMKKELQKFLHQVLKESKSQSLFVSGLSENDLDLDQVSWLSIDKKTTRSLLERDRW